MIEVKPILRKIITEKRQTDPTFNQKQLAAITGLSEPAISRFDRQTRYDINTIFIIARALNLNVEDLFEVEDNNI
jgi:transcriptional regulator with XRE-family HTH domain